MNAWRRIVISEHADLLARTDADEHQMLKKMTMNVDTDNPEETEARAARIYFRGLFGNRFNRRTENDTNAALNYGYAIILSAVNRIVASHGFSTALGINHHSTRNPFNLSCDIMEPFRPFVDEIVYRESSCFDLSMRKKLISVMSEDVVYHNKEMSLDTALDRFALDVIHTVETGEMRMGGIGFAC